jgi:hypothetical protein
MYSIGNLFTKEPAVIAGAVRAILHTLVLAGIVVLDAPLLAGISLAIEVVLTLFVRHSVTPTAAPTLKAGTSVSVQDSSDSVIIAASPPGPQGVEGGADGAVG